MAGSLHILSTSTNTPPSKTKDGHKHQVATATQHFVVFDIDSDSDEGEAEQMRLSTRRPTGMANHPVGPSGRPIAGSKRVVSHRSNGSSGSSGKFMQSITATPAFSGSSFEEMRTECYVQSTIATGGRPQTVDPVKTPWAVLPPYFNAFREDPMDDEHDLDLAMLDDARINPELAGPR
ncbi:hypothetical protein FPV67DRAFT_1455214 [Lyophyllum atratum]|nr:hypothetical protein FPV67DRAFT_1455214 [Lyophyllum atratum]